MSRSSLFLLLLSCSVGAAQNSDTKKAGYFDPIALPDFRLVVPPAPITGDLRDQIDRQMFQTTRKMEGTARWKLASEDNDLSVTGLLRAYSCAMGATIIEDDVPHLAKLLTRISTDSNAITTTVKNRYQRKRPFLVDEGAICIDRSRSLLNSYDYPSGHTTLGWLTGLVLAEVLPQRTVPILIRARSFGESRLICGVHNASAVEGGRTLGAAIFAELNGMEHFRHDLTAVRKELESRMRKEPALPKLCSGESNLIEPSPYSYAPQQ